MEEDYINGQENNLIYMKDNLWKEKETVEEHFGGLTVVGIKVNLEMEYRVDLEHYLEKEDKNNTKDIGIMECLMEKDYNFFRMDKNMKVLLNKINFMVMVYFIKMIQ